MSGRRAGATLLVALATLAAVAIALIGTFLYAWDCESGDGGVPHAAEDSPQATVCETTGSGFGALAICGLLTAATAALAAWVARRHAAGRARTLLLVAAALAVPLAPFVALALLNSPSNECTGEKLAAYEAWVEAGSSGDPPYVCQSY